MEKQAFWVPVMCERLYFKGCMHCLCVIRFAVDYVLYLDIGLSH